jgi:8-oxo-dGTP pyrophosphatase MutT (NUDIX family)
MAVQRTTATEPALARLRLRLDVPLPGAEAMAAMAPSGRQLRDTDEALRAGARLGGALILLYPDAAGAICLPLTLRPDSLPRHGGQISLPGGAVEPGETPEQAAVRELAEELGTAPADLELLGRLTPLYVAPSDFVVQPVVAACDQPPVFVPDAREVAGVLEYPIQAFVGAANRRREARLVGGTARVVPFFALGTHRVWGATAMILAELAAVWSAAQRDARDGEEA